MQSRISTPIAVSLLVVAVLLVGFVFWRSQAKSANLDEKGIPRTDINPETKPGFDAMSKIPINAQGRGTQGSQNGTR